MFFSKKRKNDRVSFDLKVLRQSGTDSKPYYLTVHFDDMDGKKTVAALLDEINADPSRRDSNGEYFSEIQWERNCLQRKCGACAMLINGSPALACGTFLADCAQKGRVTLEPLKKFPVVADLKVDRKIMFDNLKTLELWAQGDVRLKEKRREVAAEASRCLQCGCCLEVCPNFAPGEKFFGSAGYVPASRLISALDSEQEKRLRRAYIRHEYDGCSKSLACMNICPAGIDMDKLMSASAAAAVWGRK